MRKPLEHVAISAAGLILLGACSGGSASSRAAGPEVGTEMAVATLADRYVTDHIVRDETGGYFCVLRRSDDLADLRREYARRP